MGKLTRRSLTSERSSVQPSRPALAPPAAVRRSAQPGLAPALSPKPACSGRPSSATTCSRPS